MFWPLPAPDEYHEEHFFLPAESYRWFLCLMFLHWGPWRSHRDMHLFVSAAWAMAAWARGPPDDESARAAAEAALREIDPDLTVQDVHDLAPTEKPGGIELLWVWRDE